MVSVSSCISHCKGLRFEFGNKKFKVEVMTTRNSNRKEHAEEEPSAPLPPSSPVLLPSLPRSLEEELKSVDPTLLVVGVDEAGRGPLCGPVVAAAVVEEDGKGVSIEGVNDSKGVSEEHRELVFAKITDPLSGLRWGVGVVERDRIDEINILQATFEAMTSAVKRLFPSSPSLPVHVLIDGNKVPPQLSSLPYSLRSTAVVKGDGKEFLIAAASIVAKVTRDRIMREMDRDFPQYGLLKHKGYGTAEHVAALRKCGPSPHHRLSFQPLKGWMLDSRMEERWRRWREGGGEEEEGEKKEEEGVRTSRGRRKRAEENEEEQKKQELQESVIPEIKPAQPAQGKKKKVEIAQVIQEIGKAPTRRKRVPDSETLQGEKKRDQISERDARALRRAGLKEKE